MHFNRNPYGHVLLKPNSPALAIYGELDYPEEEALTGGHEGMARGKLVAQLDALTPSVNGSILKVDALWGNQPEVLDSIKAARLRRCSYTQIAKALCGDGVSISAESIKRWLESQGFE